MMKLGQFVKGNGSIPAGGTANIVHPVFTAGDKPVMICDGSFWGGDAGEVISIGLVPPAENAALGLKAWSHFIERGNGTVIQTGAMEGGLDADGSFGFFGGFTRTSAGQQLYIPPNYTLVIYANAANAAAWYANFSGFECEY